MLFCDWLFLSAGRQERPVKRSWRLRGTEHHFLRKPIAPKIRRRRRHWRRHFGSQPQRPLRRVRPPKARRRVHELDFGIASYVRIGSDIDDATKHDLTRFAIRNHNQLAWANTGRQSDHGALRKYNDGAGVFCKHLYPFRLARISFDAARSPNPNRNLKDADRDRNRLRVCLCAGGSQPGVGCAAGL